MLLVGGVALYFGLLALAYVFQRSFIYLPDTRDVSAGAGDLPGGEAIVLRTADGERLNAWWRPPAEGKPVFLYLHGNAGSLSIRLGRFVGMTQDGSGLLAVSWRGYGGSSGSPTEYGLKQDGLAAYEWLAARLPAERIVLFGESLGSGVATWLAARRPARLLALDSPYASLVDMAAVRFPLFPVRPLVKDRFMSIEEAPKVTMPVVIQHCARDFVIPISQGEKLAATFPIRPSFALIEGFCHTPDPSRGLKPLIRAELARGG